MRFRNLRRRRRQPNPPFYLLELDVPIEELMADLVYPAPAGQVVSTPTDPTR